jgi:putative spermidine/putrescine transport system substrate-binding protein
MMRWRLLAVLAALGCGGCDRVPEDGSAVVAPQAGDPVEALENELNILASPGAVERGSTDPAADWVTPFEQGTGCSVNVATAQSRIEMLTLVDRGDFDLVVAPSDVATTLIANGSVQPIDLAQLPSYANVDPRLQSAPWQVAQGRHYGTPYQWGRYLLIHDREAFDRPPASWSVLFEEKRLPMVGQGRGRVDLPEDPAFIADAALYLMKTRPGLEIRDPYELTEDQYAAALELLQQQRALVHRHVSRASEMLEDFQHNSVVVAVARPQVAKELTRNGAAVATAVPTEGASGWADTTMLTAGAKHPNCAYRWMEWSLNATVQGDVAAWLGSVPAVPAACEVNPKLGPERCASHGLAAYEELWFRRIPVPDCAAGPCVGAERWTADYAALLRSD